MAKRYKVYQSSGGDVDAVKIGWTWPGFFFGPFWILARLGIGFGCLSWILTAVVAVVLAGAIGSSLQLRQSEFGIAFNLAVLITATIFGFFGNRILDWRFQQRGLKMKQEVLADTAKHAGEVYRASVIAYDDAEA